MNNVCVPACVRTCVLAMYTQALPPPTHKLAARSITNVPSPTTVTDSCLDFSLIIHNYLRLDRIENVFGTFENYYDVVVWL